MAWWSKFGNSNPRIQFPVSYQRRRIWIVRWWVGLKRRTQGVFAAFIALIALLLVMAACSGKHSNVDPKRQLDTSKVAVVVSLNPEMRPFEIEVNALVGGWKETEIKAQSSGVVASVANEGLTFLKKNSTLATLISDGSSASYLQAKSLYDKSRIAFDSVQQLYQKQLVSTAEFLSAKADLSNAEANLKAQAKRLGEQRISVPFDAWIGDLGVEVGSYVSTGAVVAKAYDISNLKIVASIPLSYFEYVKPGEGVELSLGKESLQGQIVHVDAQTDSDSQTFSAQIKVPNPSGKLVPLNSQVRIRILGPVVSVFASDLSSLAVDGHGQAAVLGLSAGNTAMMIPVSVLQVSGEKLHFFLPRDPHHTGPISILSLGGSGFEEGDVISPLHESGEPLAASEIHYFAPETEGTPQVKVLTTQGASS